MRSYSISDKTTLQLQRWVPLVTSQTQKSSFVSQTEPSPRNRGESRAGLLIVSRTPNSTKP